MTDPSVVSVTTPPAPGTNGSHAGPTLSYEPERNPVDEPAPAATTSPLGSLRARRAALAEKMYIDLRVPRWGDMDSGPQIWVRFKPAVPSEHGKRMEQLQKQQHKPDDWAVNANAQMLVNACIGVFAVEGAEPYEQDDESRKRLSLRDGDPHGPWTKFDPDLAYALGLDQHCGAIRVVRALFFTEADVVSTANELLQWSGLVVPRQGGDFTRS